jgi:hypothetical protein
MERKIATIEHKGTLRRTIVTDDFYRTMDADHEL